MRGDGADGRDGAGFGDFNSDDPWRGEPALLSLGLIEGTRPMKPGRGTNVIVDSGVEARGLTTLFPFDEDESSSFELNRARGDRTGLLPASDVTGEASLLVPAVIDGGDF